MLLCNGEPADADRPPVQRNESPTGYSLTGCSPAEPASASPVVDTDTPSSFRRSIKCAPQPHGNVQTSPRPVNPKSGQYRCNRVRGPGCHVYFARRVTFLRCADIITADRIDYPS